jgi:hypothetical protein
MFAEKPSVAVYESLDAPLPGAPATLAPQGRKPRLAGQSNCGTASSLEKGMQENGRNVADSQRTTGTYMKGN